MKTAKQHREDIGVYEFKAGKKWKPAIHRRSHERQQNKSFISKLKRGTVIRHKSGADSYVIVDNFGNYALGVRSVHVTNPDEWDIVEK